MLPITRATAVQFCRACLEQLPKNKSEIERNHDMVIESNLYKWFQATTNLREMPKQHFDVYPSQLCHVCYTKTRTFYQFREKTISTTIAISEFIAENMVGPMNCGEILEKLKMYCVACLKSHKSLTGNVNMCLTNEVCQWLCNCIDFETNNFEALAPMQYLCKICFNKVRTFEEYRNIARKSHEYLENVLGVFEAGVYDSSKTHGTNVVINIAIKEPQSKNELKPLNFMHETTECEVLDGSSTFKLKHSLNEISIVGSPTILLKNIDAKNVSDNEMNEVESPIDWFEAKGVNSFDEETKSQDPLDDVNDSKCIFILSSPDGHKNSKKRDKNKDNIFKCSKCPQCFRKQFIYDGHVRGHEGIENPYFCDICSKTFRLSAYLSRHMRESHSKPNIDETVEGTNENQCTYCKKIFKRKNHLVHHVSAVHQRIRPHKCRFCEKSFGASKTLRVHEMRHTGERPYHCDYCDKDFRQISDLKIHQEKHTTDPDLLCPICHRAKQTPEELQAHIDLHAANKLQCTKCGRLFKKLSHLKEHDVAVHLRLRSFACSYCDKSFAIKKTLRTHEVMHTNPDSSVLCLVCPKKFRTTKNMKKHLKRHKLPTEKTKQCK